MTDDLITRLLGEEDGLVERKTEAAANAHEIRKTLVAFANSIPQGKTAVFYIGVDNNGVLLSGCCNGHVFICKTREVVDTCRFVLNG